MPVNGPENSRRPASMHVSLLARSGTKSLIIVRHPTTAAEPRATITNQRAAEILRDICLEERWGVIGMPLPTMGHSVVATSFADRELFRYWCHELEAREALP